MPAMTPTTNYCHECAAVQNNFHVVLHILSIESRQIIHTAARLFCRSRRIELCGHSDCIHQHNKIIYLQDNIIHKYSDALP
uniref:Putative ovule protein n=1 Tax=Solanum chacoense TaxID=4108 RepID=A0A0V0IPE1_SOLCH